MGFLVVIIMVIGIAGIISNQYSMIKKMEEIKETLREIKDKNKP